MADAEPVRVVVEIIDNFSDELAELRSELESIDLTKIDVNVDVDDEGDIESIKAQLEALRKKVESEVDFDSRGAERIMAEKQLLGKDIRSNIIYQQQMAKNAIAKQGGPAGIHQGILSQLEGRQFSPPESMKSVRSGLPEGRRQLGATIQSLQKQRRIMSQIGRASRSASNVAESAFPGLDVGGGGGGPLSGIRGLDVATSAKESRKSISRLRSALARLTPNIMDVWNALAIMIPVFVTLIGAAIGLAGAFLALASAGAAVVGLGMLGWGDSLSQSMKNAQQEIQYLKETLFDILSPVSAQAQPIFQQMLEGAPGQVSELVDPLEQLLGLSDVAGGAATGFIDWIGLVIQQMASMEEEIAKVAHEFGRAFGGFLIEMMSNMVQFTSENTNQIISLAHSVRLLLSTLFELSVAVSSVIATFAPMLEMVQFLASVFNNRLTPYVLSFITSVLLLNTTIAAVQTITATWAAMNGTLIASVRSATATIMSNYVPALYAWVTAANSARAATLRLLAVTGAGIGLAVAGVAAGEALVAASGGGPGAQNARRFRQGGGAQQVTNINIQGDVGRRESNRILDRMPGEARRELDITNEQSNP